MPRIYVGEYGNTDIVEKFRESSWMDIWVRIKERPGIKQFRYGITLNSGRLLEDYIKSEKEHQRENRKPNNNSVNGLQMAMDQVNSSQEIFISYYSKESYPWVPDIYTKRDTIDRAEAEKMVIFFLKSRGHRVGTIKWCRRP